MEKSTKTHKQYRCFSCAINLHWRRAKTVEKNGIVVGVKCPICECPVSELDYEAVDINEVFEGENAGKNEEVLTLPKPSWLYYCFNCLRYVPWDKVNTVIRKGRILLHRCPCCGEEVIGEKTAATWLDEQGIANTRVVRSFVFELEGDACPECRAWPFTCRVEIGYPLRCARCGATLVDFLCWFCEHRKDVREPDCCKIKHVTGRVTFCLDFRHDKRTQSQGAKGRCARANDGRL